MLKNILLKSILRTRKKPVNSKTSLRRGSCRKKLLISAQKKLNSALIQPKGKIQFEGRILAETVATFFADISNLFSKDPQEIGKMI